jgi:hypothetical protein
VVSSHVIEEKAFELSDFASHDLVEVSLDTSVDDADLLLTGERLLGDRRLRIASV